MTDLYDPILKEPLYKAIERLHAEYADEISKGDFAVSALAGSSLGMLAYSPVIALKEGGRDELLGCAKNVDAAFDAIIDALQSPQDPHKVGGVTIEQASYEGVERVSKASVVDPEEIKARDLQTDFRRAINNACKQAGGAEKPPFFGAADRRRP